LKNSGIYLAVGGALNLSRGKLSLFGDCAIHPFAYLTIFVHINLSPAGDAMPIAGRADEIVSLRP
jgi:hypothetical protein